MKKTAGHREEIKAELLRAEKSLKDEEQHGCGGEMSACAITPCLPAGRRPTYGERIRILKVTSCHLNPTLWSGKRVVVAAYYVQIGNKRNTR